MIARLGVLALLLYALWSGMVLGDLVLLWGSAFALIVVLWAGLTVVFTGLVLRRAMQRTAHPPRVEGDTEQEAMTGWHCPVPRWVPLASFTSTLNGAPTRYSRQGGRLSEWAQFPRRRLQAEIARDYLVGDGLGLFTWKLEERRGVALRILPSIDTSRGLAPPVGVVAGADLPSPFSAETGDRLDMRRYRRGDPLRLVLWSIYQRSGHLMVRAPEKAVSQHQRTGLYLLTGPKDPPAAKLARLLLECDSLGPGWRFGADGDEPWAEKEEPALDLLAASGAAEREVRVHRFLHDLARDRFGKCLVLVGPDAENRNHKIALLAHGERLPRLSLEIWVVYDPPEVPHRNTFPTAAGADMRLVERRDAGFGMVAW